MNWVYWVIGGLVLVVFILSLSLVIRNKRLQCEIQTITEKHQKELQHISAMLSSFDKDLRETFGIDYLCSASGAKHGEFLDEDFLPISPSLSNEPWGNYTMYASHAKYHFPDCRYAIGSKAKNALEIYLLRHSYSPCKYCSSRIPNVSWAIKARSYISFLLQYAPDSITAKEAQICNNKPNSYETKATIATWQKCLSQYD